PFDSRFGKKLLEERLEIVREISKREAKRQKLGTRDIGYRKPCRLVGQHFKTVEKGAQSPKAALDFIREVNALFSDSVQGKLHLSFHTSDHHTHEIDIFKNSERLDHLFVCGALCPQDSGCRNQTMLKPYAAM